MGNEVILGYGVTARMSLSMAFVLTVFLLLSCNRQKENDDGLNRLADAGSPYLREHADNPVDWYEWGPEALEKAKRENKPLIISIGYASCHWCHVMEKESFMDTAVARIMNDNFVSIKIDREERPDIDQIYLQAAQLISGNSGWPLNAFALPDGKPFYAATYFPRDQWILLLQQVIKAYGRDNDNVVRQAEALTKGIQSTDLILMPADSARQFNQGTYQDIFTHWQSSFDIDFGGLKGAPKFPMPAVWEFLLQHHHLTGNSKSLDVVTKTLDEMANGGIFDHLGGGFARYSTDTKWQVPHFEKMLYDNAQLVSLYAHAYQVTQDPMYQEVITKTLEFIRREMTSEEGGFYSSLNADSEGEEGKFYVWTKEEIQAIVDGKAADLLMDYYHITDSGNWENGKNILFRKTKQSELAATKQMSLKETSDLLDGSERILLERRNKRIRPSLDDKILLSWNALMLKGYVDAYFALGNPEYLSAAKTNAEFLDKNMLRDGGQLWRNYKDGKANIEAFLDDYALLARAYIQLYQATFDVHWLERARSVADYAIAHFRDTKSGLFFYTSDVSESLIARKMELPDNVIPSSNSVMAEVLYLLGEYYGDDSYVQTSKSMLNQVTKDIIASEPYYSNWANLMGMITYQPYEIAIMGKDALEKGKQMLKYYHPTAIFMGGEKENLPLLENKFIEGRTIIYVCRNKTCKQPVEDVIKALNQLK
jgi:uncharacterized protein